MKVDITKGEKSTCVLTVTADKEEVGKIYERTKSAALRNVSVPGFRKGKAPRQMAEKALNMTYVRSRVMEDVITSTLPKAIEENKVRALTSPDIEIVSRDIDKEFTYKAAMEIYPEIDIDEKQYKGLKMEVEKDDIKDAAVDKAVEFLREQAAVYTPIEEDRGLEKGDYALVDFECTCNGKKIKEGSVNEYSMYVQEENFVPGFVQNVLGAKKGEERTFSIKFPEDYPSVLKGKDAEFKFKLHEIRTKTLPELNDEFAKEVSDCDTYEDMLKDINKRMEEKSAARTNANAKNKAGEILHDTVSVEIPESLVIEEMNLILNRMAETYTSQGIDIFKGMSQDDINKLAETRRDEATRYAKVNVILSNIARKEKIEATDADIDERLKDLLGPDARNYRKFKNDLIKNGRIGRIETAVINEKTLQFIVDNAEITYVSPNKEEAVEAKEEPAEAKEEAVEAKEEEKA